MVYICQKREFTSTSSVDILVVELHMLRTSDVRNFDDELRIDWGRTEMLAYGDCNFVQHIGASFKKYIYYINPLQRKLRLVTKIHKKTDN